jgi:DNA-binding XRE family transcriptional regulator
MKQAVVYIRVSTANQGKSGQSIIVIYDLPPTEMIDGVACRGARAMLGLSQNELCEVAGCARKLLNDFENDIRTPSQEKRNQIRHALEAAGARFYLSNTGIVIEVRTGAASGKSPRAKAFI